MTALYNRMIERHRRSGLIIDANLLLLFLVGQTSQDADFFAAAKRLRSYTPEDYPILERIIQSFDRWVVTPNILTEVHNLLQPDSIKLAVYPAFASFVQRVHEIPVPTAELVNADSFYRFGLTDAGMLRLIDEHHFLLVTTDSQLHGFLASLGIDALNFNHYRNQF